ncbi:MAG: hypothetical protein ACYCOR_08560 [Acidobacteriaceae bacterium]
MPGGIFNRLGRALSIFGVSNPDDVRRMQARKIPPGSVKTVPSAAPQSRAGDASSQEKRTKDE